MSEPENLPIPEVINVEPREPYPELLGMTINDAAPLAEALSVFGVPDEDIANWKFYSDWPKDKEENLDHDRTVIFSIRAINSEINRRIMKHNLKNERFYDMFQPVAARTMLLDLARGVSEVERSSSSSFIVRRDKQLRLGAYFLSYAAGLTGLDLAGVHNPVEVIIPSWAMAGIVYGVTKRLSSNDRAAKKLIAKNAKEADQMRTKIEKVILPIYTPR